jgi:hypothetical protein
VETNLSALLSAGHITNANTVAQVNKAISEVGIIGAAISTAAAGIAASVAPPTPAPAAAK